MTNKIKVRSRRLALPIGADNVMWVREDSIVHIKPRGEKCDVTFGTPYKEVEQSDGLIRYSEITVNTSASEVLRACFKAQHQ